MEGPAESEIAQDKPDELERAIRSEMVTVSGQEMCFMLTSQGLKLTAVPDKNQKAKSKAAKLEKSIVWCEVITAKMDSESPKSCLTLYYMELQKNKTLRKKSVDILFKDDHVESWVTAITEQCQKVPGRPKKLFVVINPVGGNHKGEKIYHSQIAPIFELAGCETTVIVTESPNHGREIGKTQDFSGYDAIISAGGDGLYQQILHGYFLQLQEKAGIDVNDKDAQFVKPKIPFCLMPTGSSNGICAYTNDGVKDVETSALRVIRGEIHPMNILTVHEPGKLHAICGLAFGTGYMSDTMKRADELRWMKKARYLYTFIGGLLSKRKFNCEIQYLLEEKKEADEKKDGEHNQGWISHSSNGNMYTGVMVSAPDVYTVGNKCAVDYLHNTGFLLFDFGGSLLSFFKFAQIFYGKPVQEQLPNIDLLYHAVGMNLKILRDEKETDENVSRSRAKQRELEHYTFCDGEIIRMDGVEAEVRLRSGFVPMFGCIPSIMRESQGTEI